jgi:hypothetical protein
MDVSNLSFATRETFQLLLSHSEMKAAFEICKGGTVNGLTLFLCSFVPDKPHGASAYERHEQESNDHESLFHFARLQTLLN